MDQRLNELEDAIREVYASTMSRSALDYRSRRGLQKRDEQMSLLIQRVSGSYYGDAPEYDGELAKIVYVYDVSGENIRLYNDMKNEHIICYRSNG